MIEKIGFMQGRLSPMIGGKIQSFPWDSWRHEIVAAKSIDISIMEWTLDQERLYENPIMTPSGQREIISLCNKHDFSIPSLTGDCFMQAPFWKTASDDRGGLIDDFIGVLDACGSLDVQIIVVPLVDNGALTSKKEENYLIDILSDHEQSIISNRVRIAFESDFSPVALERFIDKLNPSLFGINYDIGNSAALGFNVNEEFKSYGNRILNVHVKDRPLGGTTVPLGEGNADFEAVFSKLSECAYKGNYILQTARDSSGQHSKVIKNYLDKTINWVSEYES